MKKAIDINWRALEFCNNDYFNIMKRYAISKNIQAIQFCNEFNIHCEEFAKNKECVKYMQHYKKYFGYAYINLTPSEIFQKDKNMYAYLKEDKYINPSSMKELTKLVCLDKNPLAYKIEKEPSDELEEVLKCHLENYTQQKFDCSCSICQNTDECIYFVKLINCCHIFHYGCISKWIKQNRDALCPLCKKIINKKQPDYITNTISDCECENNSEESIYKQSKEKNESKDEIESSESEEESGNE
jgi:hypothetical protein